MVLIPEKLENMVNLRRFKNVIILIRITEVTEKLFKAVKLGS